MSKEFRKTYKRIGVIDKEIDVMKYRQNMANKKASNVKVHFELFTFVYRLNIRRNFEVQYVRFQRFQKIKKR